MKNKSKTTVNLLVFLSMIVLAFAACKKDKTPLTVTDYDGNVYQTVKIGNQIWMAENLKTTRYRNGDYLYNIENTSLWLNAGENGAWCDNPNEPNYAKTYGHLYNWYAVNDSRKIAPVGWRVPTDEDWTTLINYLESQSPQMPGAKLKEAGFAHWDSQNIGATNETGFTALPGGYRIGLGYDFYFDKTDGYWWSSTQVTNDNTRAWEIELNSASDQVYRDNLQKSVGLSVRCIKGE